jgi:hypothetical protein
MIIIIIKYFYYINNSTFKTIIYTYYVKRVQYIIIELIVFYILHTLTL